jgi:hypothetical protein
MIAVETDSLLTKVPYRILTPRLELRCYQPDDDRLVSEAISVSVPHLARYHRWTDGAL